MKKIVKYLLWLPFAVSIGSFALYFIYALRIKFGSIDVTNAIQNSLKLYLIIGLISLFIGLFVVFIKKLIMLFKEDDMNEPYIKQKNSIKEEIKNNVGKIDVLSNKEEVISNKNELVLKIENPVFLGNKITGILDGTNQNIEVYIDEKKETIKSDKIKCSECGNYISKDAAICPHCGVLFDENILKIINKNEKKLKKKNKKFSLKKFILDIVLIILFMILIFLVGNLLINKSAENYNNINGTSISNLK